MMHLGFVGMLPFLLLSVPERAYTQEAHPREVRDLRITVASMDYRNPAQSRRSTALLERQSHLSVKDVPLTKALILLGERAQVTVAFSEQFVPREVAITCACEDLTLAETLDRLLRDTSLRYHVVGSHVLILPFSPAGSLIRASSQLPVQPTTRRLPVLPTGLRQPRQLAVTRQGTVTGQVTELGTERPIERARVGIAGTTLGDLTDAEGSFEIQDVPAGVVDVEVEMLGYASASQSVRVGSGATVTVNFELSPSALTMDEIVVVGYGTARRQDLTGSITSVDADQFQGEAISSLEQGLQGKAAGVNVTSSSGRPGGAAIVRIRGSTSILGSNDPLYVVDGVPIQAGTSGRTSMMAMLDPGNSGGTSMLAMLDPGNIESIDILKDASATAIYGSRGSNGVIIITTKQGRPGTHTIDVQSSAGVHQVENRLEMMNSRQFAEIVNERATNDGGSPIFEDVEALAQTNTDWQAEIFRPAQVYNHSLRFSGGDETTQYAVTATLYDEDGVIRASDFRRASLRVNLDQQINRRLSIGTRSFFSHSVTNAIPERLLLKSALQAPPFMTVFDEDGNYTSAGALKQFPFSASEGENPVALAEEQLDKRVMDRLIGNVSLDYDLSTNLTLRTLVGMDRHGAEQNSYNPRTLDIGLPAGSGYRGTTTSTSLLNENALTFQSDVRENDRLNIMAGVTWQRDQEQFLTGSASDFVTDDLLSDILGSGENYSAPATGFSESTLVSGLARVNYALDDRYLFTVSGRADGSSRFGTGNKWGWFPSGAFAWILSEEDFIRRRFRQLSHLKLRLSYGVSGNQPNLPYESLQRFSATSLAFGGAPTSGFVPANLGNPDLRWETTREFNAGLEASFWDHRLAVNADYYLKNTSDLLALVNVPPSVGFNTTLQNVGSTRNRGVELAVNAAILRGETSWDIGVNVSANRNTVTRTAGGQDIIAPGINVLGSANIIREGEPLGAFYGLVTDGLTEDGLFNYVDQNGDGEIDDADRVILGDPYPDFVYGLSTDVQYKSFHLRAAIQGEYGRQMWNNNRYRFMSSAHRGQVPIADVAHKRWTPENPDPNAPYPRATSTLNQRPSDWYIEDASYLRLQNVQLTYDVPQDMSRSIGLERASVRVSGQNLITLTEYSWYTPDVNTFDSGDLRIGVDHRSYPSARMISVGVEVGF